MITVYADNREIRVNVPTLGMSPEKVHSFLIWLQADAARRHQELAGDISSELQEQIKSVWWAENQERLIRYPRPIR